MCAPYESVGSVGAGFKPAPTGRTPGCAPTNTQAKPPLTRCRPLTGVREFWQFRAAPVCTGLTLAATFFNFHSPLVQNLCRTHYCCGPGLAARTFRRCYRRRCGGPSLSERLGLRTLHRQGGYGGRPETAGHEGGAIYGVDFWIKTDLPDQNISNLGPGKPRLRSGFPAFPLVGKGNERGAGTAGPGLMPPALTLLPTDPRPGGRPPGGRRRLPVGPGRR